VTRVLISNFEQLLSADYLTGQPGMEYLIRDMLEAFSRECEKKDAPKLFRIHWDGDFFSESYARAWAYAIRYHSDIQFWAYTRSFTEELNVVPILAGIPNLTLYLSADPINIERANKVSGEHAGIFIATVADTFAEARDTLIDSERKSYACPENGKRLPLIDPKGSACVRCGICIEGRGDVLFSVKKK
jgi:hypothetical protein